MRLVGRLALLLCLAAPAHAVDGVLEINQTCAVQTGCFAGDAAGFPVTIATPGSYRLTSALSYASDASSALVIANSDIAIDLNGFTIKGTNTCTTGAGGFVTSCTQAAFEIHAIDGGGAVRIRVTNGRVLGCGGVGIQLADAAEVSRVQVSDCAAGGIVVGSRSSVDASSVIGNGNEGVMLGGSGSVRDVIATNNAHAGIFANGGSTVAGNTSANNGFYGIVTGSGATVQNNTVRSNGFVGLSLGSASSYSGNTISANTVGAVSAAGSVNAGGNACNGAPCP